MSISKRMLKYARENYNEVKHTTLNPEGPGVVRIHLIPPKVTDDDIGPSVVILNGQDIVPLDVSWTILMCEFISEVNKYSGREVNEAEVAQIIKDTCRRMRKIYPLIPGRYFISDIDTIMTTFKQIAYREKVTEDIPYMSLGEYAPYMRAPHRMDLMVSAMTKDDKWHCNLKCLHCYAAGQQHSGETELDTEDWKKIMDKLKEACVPQITFTGGEPTMREDLCELIEYGEWFITRLNTNGVKLTKEYCHALKAASLDSIQITLYSGDKDIHNRLVGAEGHEMSVSGIKNALELGMSVSVNTPLCTLNEDYVSTAIMAAVKGHPLIREWMSAYEQKSFILPDGTMNLETNVVSITNSMKRHDLRLDNTIQTVEDFTFYPKDYFCPKSYIDGRIYKTSNTVTIHHFAGSWLSEAEKKRDAERIAFERNERFTRPVKELAKSFIGERLYGKIKERLKR